MRFTSLLVVALLAGCTVPKTAAHPVELVSKAESQNQSAKSSVDQAKVHTDKTGIIHLGNATAALNQQSKTFLDLRSSLTQQQTKQDNAARELDELQGKWFVRWGRVIDGLLKALTATVILAIVLRVLSLVLLGSHPGIAKIMGMVANGVFGVMTLGLTTLTSVADVHEAKKAKK